MLMSKLTWPTGGGGVTQVVTHRVRVQPPRSMKAISGDVEALLGGLKEDTRRSGAFLATELVAQAIGRAPGSPSGPVGLTVQLREDAIRLEATGPIAPSNGAAAGHDDAIPADPLAEWGWFILDRLSDRWGVGGGARRAIWAEIR
jgi:hypothetical protein